MNFLKNAIVILSFASFAFEEVLETLDSNLIETTQFKKIRDPPQTCEGELGCFPLTDDFTDPKVRPISFTPSRRDKVKTRILLYTKLNPKPDDAYQMLAWNMPNFEQSPFNSSLPVKFLIPGYTDSTIIGLWIIETVNALLNQGYYNVFVIEWRNIIPYDVAASDSRIVGAEIASFIAFLLKNNFALPENIHLIGHSLGAHIAAYAGQETPNLGRITGLDPARPLFQGLPPSTRLSPDDALFVDVIHSDFNPFFSLGTTHSVGHVDFFLNGASPQPGCFLRDRLIRGIEDGSRDSNIWTFVTQKVRYIVACSHQRSHEVFLESIIGDKFGCTFVGLKCSDYESFLSGGCDCSDSINACAVLGLHADKYFESEKVGNNSDLGRWYLRTASSRPYCLHQYQVVIQLGAHKLPLLKGNMYLKLHYLVNRSPGTIVLKITPPNSLLSSALRMTHVVTLKESIGEIQIVSFMWLPEELEYLHRREHLRIRLKYIKISPIKSLHNRYSKFRNSDSSKQYFCYNTFSLKSFQMVTLKASNYC